MVGPLSGSAAGLGRDDARCVLAPLPGCIEAAGPHQGFTGALRYPNTVKLWGGGRQKVLPRLEWLFAGASERGLRAGAHAPKLFGVHALVS